LLGLDISQWIVDLQLDSRILTIIL
jgi:hypothetical protein